MGRYFAYRGFPVVRKRRQLHPQAAQSVPTLAVPYAFQVAVEAPRSDIDPLAFEGQAIKLSALDLLKVLV